MFKIFKLGEVCSIESGSRGKGGASTEGIPSIGGEQISSTGYVLTEKMKYITEEHFKKMKQGVIKPDDTLLVKDGATTGKCAFYRNEYKEATVNEHVFILRANNLILPKFLYYVITSDKFQNKIKSNIKGIIGGINLSIKNLEIVIPDKLAEQQEIVQVLDTMSNIIRLREECISHAQDLIPALFQEMFGDINNNVTKSNIVTFRNCIELNPAKPNLKDNLNVTFLGMKDISENGQVNLSTIKMYEDVKKGFTNFGNEDVLLAKITPCFENGKAAIVRNLTNGYGFGSTEFYVLRPHKKLILPEYVYSIIKSHSFVEPGKYKMVGAAGQKRLPKEYVLNYKFPLPSIELQEQFAEKVRAINSYIKEQNEELKNAKQMFQSLLHHAFTGELTNNKPQGDTLEK